MKYDFLYILACALFISGCASHNYMKTYEGTLPSDRKPVLVKPVAFIVIRKIDEKEVYIAPSAGTTTEYELEFVPGEHFLEVQYDSGVLLSDETLSFPIKVESGRKYIIRPNVDRAHWNNQLWRPQLIDVTDRQQCWTISVGTRFGPKGCD